MAQNKKIFLCLFILYFDIFMRTMSNLNRSNFQGHPFHLVSPSPWPILTCLSLLTLTTAGVLTMHGFSNAGIWLFLAFISVVSSMSFWFRDVISEGTYLGNHTLAVQRGLNMGVALFIVSEGLFFLAIFWAYFHSALSPTVELGAQWPPLGIEAINAFELPLLNTVLLLASGRDNCLKCNKLINLTNNKQTKKKPILTLKKKDTFFFCAMSYSNLPFSSPKVLSTSRIGPHNYNVLSLLIGSLLGDAHMERDGNGSRVCFYQKGDHIEYIIWLHSTLLSYGYCKESVPQIYSRIINDKLVYYCRFRTFTYSSFNSLYDEFYVNKVKVVPNLVEIYMSPLALSVWIMDDGTWIKNRGISLATNSYSLSNVKYLINVLENKFGLNGLSAVKAGGINQYMIYIPKRNLSILIPLIKPHIHPIFLYKLGSI